MFSGIRRAFGLIKVEESQTEIEISGIPADVLARDIGKMWNTERINRAMFTQITANSIRFPKFFAIEIHYILQQIDQYRNAKSTSRTLRHMIQGLEENTWLKRLNEEPTSRIDLSQLKNLNAKLFEHQNGFLHAYGELTNRYGLNGYLLSADPGTGKTIMGLAAAECLHADLVVVVSPKPAVYRVWVDTVKWLYKKPRAYWVAGEGIPWKNQRIIITHYEALNKALDVIKRIPHQKAVVILDESHNLNEAKSNRTQLFLDVVKAVKTENALWSSGTPLKAMGYEMIPFLRSIDPLFTDDVEKRFMAIFGRASDRALDILRNRIGKISFHVSGATVIDVKKHYEEMKITVPNGEQYTLDVIREKMKKYIDERMTYYLKNMKDYRRRYDAGVEAYEKVMSPDDKDKLKKYKRDIAMISKGYDTRNPEMVEAAKYCNLFEKKIIIPAIKDKAVKDAFDDARAVIKYVKLRVIGESLGVVVGKARAACHVEMVKQVDWKDIAAKSEKKVIVFTSFVEVVKAADEAIKRAGYKTLLVYGDTSSNVAGIVDQFAKDPNIKFMIATFQTLSTAVPLTMADATVYVNQPWRSFEKEQADARTARIGQDKGVTYIDLLLDTGKEPNISTRAKDIMEWSREMVASLGIGGAGADKETISAELNKDYNLGAMEAFAPPKETHFGQAMESYLSSLEANEEPSHETQGLLG